MYSLTAITLDVTLLGDPLPKWINIRDFADSCESYLDSVDDKYCGM
jgi:hypothetical protein